MSAVRLETPAQQPSADRTEDQSKQGQASGWHPVQKGALEVEAHIRGVGWINPDRVAAADGIALQTLHDPRIAGRRIDRFAGGPVWLWLSLYMKGDGELIDGCAVTGLQQQAA